MVGEHALGMSRQGEKTSLINLLVVVLTRERVVLLCLLEPTSTHAVLRGPTGGQPAGGKADGHRARAGDVLRQLKLRLLGVPTSKRRVCVGGGGGNTSGATIIPLWSAYPVGSFRHGASVQRRKQMLGLEADRWN